MNDRFGQGGFSPVKEGEEHDVKIEAVGEKGDGIARIQGFVVFVPGVREGDEVKIKVTKVLQKVGFGEVVGKATISQNDKKSAKPAKKQVEEEPEEVFDTSKDSEDFGEDEEEKEE